MMTKETVALQAVSDYINQYREGLIPDVECFDKIVWEVMRVLEMKKE